MSDLSELEKAAKSGTVQIQRQPDGNFRAVLGLDTSGNRGNHIVPIEMTFDKQGNALYAHVPNQNRSGGSYVDLHEATKVKDALIKNASRSGADFLTGVSKTLGGWENHETHHTDSRKSLGSSNPDAVARTNLHAEVAGKVMGAAGRAVGTFDRVAKPLALAAGLMAAATGARASDGTASGMAEGAAAGFVEHLAPEVANGNSTCTKLGGVTKVGAGGALGIIGFGAAGVLGAVGGAWAGDKIGDGVEAACKWATQGISADNKAMVQHKPTTQTVTSTKAPDTAVAQATSNGREGRS